MDRLVDDFQLMIEVAYNKHSERKERAVSVGVGTEGEETMGSSKEK